MHIKDKYKISEFWQPQPEKIRKRIELDKFNEIVENENGVLNIFGDLYEVIGEDKLCKTVTMRVQKLF